MKSSFKSNILPAAAKKYNSLDKFVSPKPNKTKETLKKVDLSVIKGEGEDIINLSETQLLMLKMSDEDIKNNRVMSHEQADKRDLQWLKSL